MCDDDSTIYDSGETIYCDAPRTASDRLCYIPTANRLYVVFNVYDLTELQYIPLYYIIDIRCEIYYRNEN